MNERNENILTAEKEEAFLCYLNLHVNTVHEEKKIVLCVKERKHEYITKLNVRKIKIKKQKS